MARIEALGDIYGESVVEEVTLMRFLRARALDADRAELMLLNMLKWREENKANGYLETYKPLKKEIMQYTGGVHKKDLEGDPVLINRLGMIDAKGIMYAFGEEEMLKVSLSFFFILLFTLLHFSLPHFLLSAPFVLSTPFSFHFPLSLVTIILFPASF